MAGRASRPVVSPPPATWAVDTGPLTCRRSTQCRAGRCRPARGSRAPPSPGTAGRQGHRGAGLAPRAEPGRGWASRTQLPLPSTLSPGCHCQGAWAGGEEAGDGQTGGHQQAPGDETREGWERHPHLPRFPGTGHLRQAGQHVTLSAAGLGARATCWATLAPGLLAPGLALAAGRSSAGPGRSGGGAGTPPAGAGGRDGRRPAIAQGRRSGPSGKALLGARVARRGSRSRRGRPEPTAQKTGCSEGARGSPRRAAGDREGPRWGRRRCRCGVGLPHVFISGGLGAPLQRH